MGFNGLRILSLESRRSREIERLIRIQGGDPFVAPSMRELPIEDNPAAFRFGEKFFSGEFDMLILLTGVGTRLLRQVLATRWPSDAFIEGLRTISVVARGPKPMAVLREWEVPAAVVVPEPNTWREVLAATEGRPEKRIAVQEYGKPSVELVSGLRARGAEVTPVPVYQWTLPADLKPLREAVRRVANGDVDVLLLTASIQITNFLKIASEMGCEAKARAALARTVIASVGPSTTEVLLECGFRPDLEPSHPKMGFLVTEAASGAHRILQEKQT
jgi:uroporphyrinogen-III synthase